MKLLGGGGLALRRPTLKPKPANNPPNSRKQVDKLGELFNASVVPLRYTPRKLAPLPDGNLVIDPL